MLLAKLIAKQGAMSDVAFARFLGIPRSTWQLTRTGKVPLGATVAKAAQRTYGDLAPDVIFFLLSYASPEAPMVSHEAAAIAS